MESYHTHIPIYLWSLYSKGAYVGVAWDGGEFGKHRADAHCLLCRDGNHLIGGDRGVERAVDGGGNIGPRTVVLHDQKVDQNRAKGLGD